MTAMDDEERLRRENEMLAARDAARRVKLRLGLEKPMNRVSRRRGVTATAGNLTSHEFTEFVRMMKRELPSAVAVAWFATLTPDELWVIYEEGLRVAAMAQAADWESLRDRVQEARDF
jgi:hypothetical protein